MPTIIQIGAIKIKIHGGDHNPPHVHVEGPAEQNAVINLTDLVVTHNAGYSGKVLRAICAEVSKYRDHLLAEWSEING